MYNYFQAKYSYSQNDLESLFGEDFEKFRDLMESRDLINPKNLAQNIAMQKEVDSFMDIMIYNKKRRRN